MTLVSTAWRSSTSLFKARVWYAGEAPEMASEMTVPPTAQLPPMGASTDSAGARTRTRLAPGWLSR